MACTTILVGKKATYDGSTMVARNEDSPSGEFTPKNFTVVHPKDQGETYKSVLSHLEIELPSDPMKYTCMPNAIDKEGVWGACGVNEANVSMSATETLTSNDRVQGADPLVEYEAQKGEEGQEGYKPEKPGGIGEEDMVTLVLPYIRSAKEGVLRLGELLETYGTYEMNGIAFQDEDEIWWLETIGGHHWIARRVPDNAYVIMPNQLGLDHFDFEDANGKQKDFLCSKDLKEFVEKFHLDLSFDNKFNPRDAFGSHSDADHVYNTPRAWILHEYFNPSSKNLYKPDCDNIPWMRVPEKKINPEDIKYALSHHYQGTKYDPYDSNPENGDKGKFRPIGINRNNFLGLVQISAHRSDSVKSLEWLSLGSNVFNAMVPFYVNIDHTPEYLANATQRVSTDNFYWTNRIIGALCDAHYNETSSPVEQYQARIGALCRQVIHEYDAKMEGLSEDEVIEVCHEANEKIAQISKRETDKLLAQVLYIASNRMKNGFARSDA